MMRKVRARAAGGSVTVTLPAAVVERLGITAGADLWAVDHAQGVLIVPAGPDFDAFVKEFEEGSAKYDSVLRALALRRQ